MANLIVTIISIALVAVAAVMGIFYGGTAYQQTQYAAMSATLLSQSKQLIAANTQYMLDHNFTSFEDFPNDVINNGFYLAEPIPVLNLQTNYGPQYSLGCAQSTGAAYINGYPVAIIRSHANVFGSNGIVYDFFGTPTPTANNCLAQSMGSVDFSLATNTNHPLVQICLQINKNVRIPADLPIAASGLPYLNMSTGEQTSNAFYEYSSNPEVVNFCLLQKNMYFGSGSYNEIILVVLN